MWSNSDIHDPANDRKIIKGSVRQYYKEPGSPSDSEARMVPSLFATTLWSVVLAPGGGESPQASAALEQLCRTYWYPLDAYVHRRGY